MDGKLSCSMTADNAEFTKIRHPKNKMDVKLSCSVTAENAAFTKIRHLENRMDETDKKLDEVEQQVLENTNAFNEHVTKVSKKLETKELSATSATANNATFTNAEVSNLNSSDVTATTITAETINVDNLENVNVLHGKTVDVDKTIATIGQFAETHTTEANNTTTNTTELNVSKEANLTGQVNIDGNLTFIKDNGLSKLQGKYLEVDAANVVINNNDNEAYALYVPGIYGQALFGGSVIVQDTLLAKDLVVLGDVLMKGLKLGESTELTNPTFKGIKGTNELTTTALVIDSEGKLVSKKISSEVEGAVASSLVCKKEITNSTLLDEWKFTEDNPVYKLPVSPKAQFVIKETTGEILLVNENGNQIKVSDLGVTINSTLYSVVHRNFVYVIKPTVENGNTFKCVIIPINTNTMEVSPSFDITQYFGEVSSSDLSGDIFSVVTTKTIYQPAVYGMVLSEDVPTIGFIGTNTYINLSTMEVKTRDTAFGNKWCVLSKNDNWIELSGPVLGEDGYYCTNGKYSSVEDAALGVPACEYILDKDTNKISQQLFYVDAPVFGMNNKNSLVYLDGGIIKNVAFSDIPGNSTYENAFGTVDKDGNPVYFGPASITAYNSFHTCNLYLTGGYYPREYFNTTTSYVETIVIDDTKVEVNGSTFYDGVWYDKVVSSTKDLIDFITKKKDNKRYKVLSLGNIAFDTSDSSQFPKEFTSNDIYGTFDIYHLRDNSHKFTLELNGTQGTATRISSLIDACHWHGFNTRVSLLFCNNALFRILFPDDNVSYLHINDCNLEFNTNNTGRNSKYYLGISDSNNVTYSRVVIPDNLFSDAENKKVDLTLTNCYNIVFNDNNSVSNASYSYSKLLFNFSDRCEANIYSLVSNVSKQSGPGYNFVYNAARSEGAKVETPTFVYKARA